MSTPDKVVKLRRYSFDEKSEIEVTLRPRRHSTTEWTVLYDGQEIGTVGKYTGSLDRKIAGTRLRSPGKRRTLWSHRGTYKDARTFHECVSRADAIRWLLSEAGIR